MKHLVHVIFLTFFMCVQAQVDSVVRPLKLTDVISNPQFYPQTLSELRSMKDGVHYTFLEENCIIRTDYATGKEIDTLFSPSMVTNLPIPALSGYSFCADESKLLLETSVQPIYRRSYTAKYYWFDIEKRCLTSLFKGREVQLATISPTGNLIAYVWQNNLYLNDPAIGSEIQVTTDGKIHKIINGVPDWVYEEEFEYNQAFEWSPNGQYLAWVRFDESQVRTYSFDVFDSIYPSRYTYKYPKAGEVNSKVSVWVYDTYSGKKHSINLMGDSDVYIPRIHWATQSGELSIWKLNRRQNQVDILLANVNTGNNRILYSERDNRFLSCISDAFITFLPNGFLVFSERSGYRHFYRYSMDGKFMNVVTKGDFDDGELLGIDTLQQMIYYTSTETSPLNRTVYAIGWNGKAKMRRSPAEGTSTVSFSSNFTYGIQSWCDANTPYRFVVVDGKGKEIRVLEDNGLLNQRINEAHFVPKTFFTITHKDSVKLYGYMVKPPKFDSTQRYPVLMIVYGGPHSQYVTNDWDYRIGWLQLLAQKGYVVVCVDNRGTDGRGEAFRKCTYLQLGKLETEDQLAAARYLSTFPFVDSTRLGIFGWSYGGTMASLGMMVGDGLFRMGIAVAPVTDWRFYDTVYAERYMRTPQENEKGYNSNSPLAEANNLKGSFLLIHGSADDNVHLQNSMELAEKLISCNILFDFFIYPDKNHGIYGGRTRLHLYEKITGYILQKL